MKKIIIIIILLTPCLSWAAANPKLQWNRHYRQWFRHTEAARPTLTKQFVLIGTQDGSFHALDRQSGREKWRYKTKFRIDGQAGTGGEKVFFGDSKGMLHALRLQSGALVWKKQYDTPIRSAPRFVKGMLYVQTLGNELFALDAETGKEIWTYKATNFGTLPLLVPSRPLVRDGVVYATFPSGIVIALEAMDGHILWQRNLGTADLAFSALSSALLQGQSLLIAVHGKGLFSISKNDGTLQWQFDESQALFLAKDTDRIYLATLTGKIFALDQHDGKGIWQQKILNDPDTVLMGLARIGDTLYVTDSENRAWGLNREQGQKVWEFNPFFDGSGFASAPTAQKNTLVLWTQHGNLYTFETH